MFLVTVWNLEKSFLEPLKETLTEFVFENLMNYIDISDLFGQGEMPNLTLVDISYNKSLRIDRVLTGKSFSALADLRHIGLYDCAIVAILEGTFDHLRESLIVLRLYNNRLKVLSMKVFAGIFNFGLLERLDLTKNPLECNCDYYEMRNLSVIQSLPMVFCPPCICAVEEASIDQSKCRKLQFIHSRPNCFQHDEFDVFAHPVIELRVVAEDTGDLLQFRSATGDGLKLIVTDGKKVNKKRSHDCGLKCVLLLNGTSIIPFAWLNRTSEIVSFFVTYHTNPARIWPLNYQTVRREATHSGVNEDLNSNGIKLIPTSLIICGFGFVGGFLLLLLIHRIRRSIAYVPPRNSGCG